MEYTEIEIGYNPNNENFQEMKDRILRGDKINKVENMEDLYKLKDQEFVDNVSWQNFDTPDEIITYNISPPPPPPPPPRIIRVIRSTYCATA